MKALKLRHLIALLLYISGGVVPKQSLLNQVRNLGLLLDRDFEVRCVPTGLYSPDFELATSELVGLGFIDKTFSKAGKEFHYTLTPSGTKLVEQLKGRMREND